MAHKRRHHEGPAPKFDQHEEIFRKILSKTISQSSMDRYEIAAGISALTGRSLSKDMLDKWCSQNREYGPKVIELLALCTVTNNLDPIDFFLKQFNCSLITTEAMPYLKLATAMVELAKAHLLLTEQREQQRIVDAIFPPLGGAK